MRVGDWSSEVCSSDLAAARTPTLADRQAVGFRELVNVCARTRSGTLRSDRRNDLGVFYSGNARHGSDDRDRGLTAAGHHVDVWRLEMRQAVDGRNTERTERCRCQINDALAAAAYYGVVQMVCARRSRIDDE